ncbi:MAG: hypothetical protein ACJ76Z_05725 [Thermoleophilaceae bacterium]
MANLPEMLKRLMRRKPRLVNRPNRAPRRRDPDFVGGSSIKDIENAPPGRAQELAGHAPERVDT